MVKSVKVYSTSSCPYCVMLKDFLKKNNVEFTDIDVGADQGAAREMIQKSGQMGVPVVDIDGTLIVGFNRESIIKALGI
jgi:glutaredoxin 3